MVFSPLDPHFITWYVDFETEEEYETAMGLVSGTLQELFAEGDGSILQELLQRCPHYESTHTILRAPLTRSLKFGCNDLFAYVLDMGADSVEITNDTKLSELVDVVNSEAYRTYHGLGRGSTGDRLLFELYVSLLAQ